MLPSDNFLLPLSGVSHRFLNSLHLLAFLLLIFNPLQEPPKSPIQPLLPRIIPLVSALTPLRRQPPLRLFLGLLFRDLLFPSGAAPTFLLEVFVWDDLHDLDFPFPDTKDQGFAVDDEAVCVFWFPVLARCEFEHVAHTFLFCAGAVPDVGAFLGAEAVPFGAGGDEAGGVEDAGYGLGDDEGGGERDVQGGRVERCCYGGEFVEGGIHVWGGVLGNGG